MADDLDEAELSEQEVGGDVSGQQLQEHGVNDSDYYSASATVTLTEDVARPEISTQTNFVGVSWLVDTHQTNSRAHSLCFLLFLSQLSPVSPSLFCI